MEIPQPATKPGRFRLDSIGPFIKKYWSDYLITFLVAGAIVDHRPMDKGLGTGERSAGGRLAARLVDLADAVCARALLV